jgi:hypothetical protein
MKYKCRRYYELDCRIHTIEPYRDGEDPSITELYTKTWSYVKHGRGNIKAQKDRYYAKYRDVILEKKRVNKVIRLILKKGAIPVHRKRGQQRERGQPCTHARTKNNSADTGTMSGRRLTLTPPPIF